MADAPSSVAPQAALEATYKGREVEGFLDLHFYRHVGYRLAISAQRLNLTPAVVTLLGGIVGIAAGHCYFYADLRLNGLGMLLHVTSNSLDNADGQLARLTGTGSRLGRAFDGFIDNLVFASIYLHLCLRYTATGGSPGIWLLGVAAAASHSIQSASTDYLRNAYLYFSGVRSELESSNEVRSSLVNCPSSYPWWKRLLLAVYLNYTIQQERLAPKVAQLRSLIGTLASAPSTQISDRYRTESVPLLKLTGALTTNSRMIILFSLLLFQRPVWYLVVEVTALNVILAIVLLRQNLVADRLANNRF